MLEGFMFMGWMILGVWGILVLPIAFLEWLDRRDK